MTTEQMRQALLKRYPGRKWADKVNAMPDGQVFVIYTRLKIKKEI